jgi:hypothetical protein
MAVLTQFMVPKALLAVEIWETPFQVCPRREDVLVSLQLGRAVALYWIREAVQKRK